MTKTVTYVFKPEQIDGAILAVENDAKTLKQKIHNVAVAIIMDWQNNSAAKKITDEKAHEAALIAVDRLNRLQSASPYHANAFAKWVGMFTPCLWSDENKSWYVSTTDSRMMGQAFMAARDKPFWEVSPPAQVKPFDMWEALQKLVDKASKHVKTPVDGDEIDKETLRTLVTLVSQHNAAEGAK